MILVKHTDKVLKNDNVVNLTVEDWDNLYEKLFGGFEDLEQEDSYSDEEEIPEHLQTKEGYSKEGGFIVSDDEEDEEYIPEKEEEEAHSSTDDAEEEDIMGKESDIEAEEEEEEEDEDEESDEDDYESDLGSELSEESYIDSD
jgi:hypothetical protein